ncbi:MAG: hypothetical protein Q4B13_04430 [Lautropia sp.]|nr:hypothetical protein [Lautropia sp.]
MSGNQKQVRRTRIQSTSSSGHSRLWSAPLLSIYALSPVLAWATATDTGLLVSDRSDLQQAVVPTVPAGIGSTLSGDAPLQNGIARITVELDRNNVPADGQSPVKLRIRAFDSHNQGIAGDSFVNIEVSAGRLQLPGARSDEQGLMPADLNLVEPGMRVALHNGHADVLLLAPPAPQTVDIQVSAGPIRVQGQVEFVPELRDMIAAGFVEGIISLRHQHALSLEEARPSDGFEDQIQNWTRQSGNGKRNAGLQSAFFLKGKVRGDMLLTMAYDSEHPDNNRLFRDLDPERWYPVYGDSSLVGFDAQSNSRLYVRLDKNRNYLLYGDITTGNGFSERAGQGQVARLQNRDLGQYERSMTGVRGHIEGPKGFFDSFAANDSLRQVVEEFPSRGISGPYTVTNAANAVLGTEQVVMIVRDRHAPARILDRKPLTRFIDYTFEPFSGRILMARPVPSLDENLNPVSVRITYEVDQGGQKYWVYGVNGAYQPTEGTDVGASWVKDRNPLAPFEMGSANVGTTLGDKGWARAEIARTRSNADSAGGRRYNLDPNLNTGEIAGNAWRAEAGYEGDKGAIGAWYGQSDIGFNNPASSFAGGQRQGGIEARRVLRETTPSRAVTDSGNAPLPQQDSAEVSSAHADTTATQDATDASDNAPHQTGVAVYTRGNFVADRQTDAERTQIQAGVQLDLSPKVRLEIGANRVDEQAGNNPQDGLTTASNLSAPYGIGVVDQGFGGGMYGSSNSALDPIRGETLYNTGASWSTGYGSSVGSGLAGVPVEYTAAQLGLSILPTERWRIGAEIEQDVRHDEHRRAALGTSYRIQDKTRLFGRYEWNTGLSSVATSATIIDPQTGAQIASPYRSNAFVFGLDTEYMEDGTVYSEYRMYDAISSRQAQWANGIRNIWRLSPRLSLQTGAEHLKVLDGSDRSASAITTGIQWQPTERWQLANRLEWRHTGGQSDTGASTPQSSPYLSGYDSWLSTLSISRKLNQDWTALMRNYYLLNDFGNQTPKRYENRFQLGLAYRDSDTNRVNTLFRYEYWRRYDPILQTSLEPQPDGYTKHIGSLVSDWHPNRNWWLTGRLAGKRQTDRFASGDSHFRAWLAGGRLTYGLGERWDISGIVYRMWSPHLNSQNAFGTELGYLVTSNLWLSGGYNWSGFRDHDLTGSEYTSQGAYLRLRFKFDERLFKGNDPEVNRTLDR